jgi:hypothetical protein
MMRSSTDPGSPYYAAFVTPSNGIAVQWRPGQGYTTQQLLVPGAVPAYLRVGRYTSNGQTYYTAYTSSDGTSWSAIPGSTQVLTLAEPLLAGFAITSHNQGTGSAVTLDSVAVTTGEFIPPGVCPASWSCTDIGGAQPPGQDTLTNAGTWNEVAGGGDIWGTADSFHLVTQPLNGDGTATAHITSQQATDPFAKAGPMMRSTSDPGSPYYAAFITPGHGIAVQWRSSQGGSTQQLLVSGTVPTYLAVNRYTTSTQTVYTASMSTDGVNWTPIPGSTQALNLGQSLLAGLGITSHNQGMGSAVSLDTVSVTSGEFPPPGFQCPQGWSCGDIGAASPAGNQTLTSGSWTIQGGGPDIWGTADAYHFVWQPLPGDGSVNSAVTSLSASDPSAKAGVMIRGSTDPGAPYYAAYVTPGNGVVVQIRTGQAVAATQIATLSGTAPVYLKVTRTGTTFSAATSSDGVTWTPVSGSSVSMPNLGGSALAGLAVTSHNSGVVGTATFGSVAIG